MPRVFTRQRSGVTIDLKPIGGEGIVLSTDGAMLSPQAMRQARNIDATSTLYRSRMGDAKIALLEDAAVAYGAKVFGDDSKYAFFAPPLIGLGGFWFKFHLTAVRPLSAGTRYILSSWTTAAQTHYVVQMTLTDTGVFTISVEWEGGGTNSLTATFDNGASVHGLLVYDAVAGTLSLYVDGDVVDGPDVIGTDKQPRQDANVNWYVGLSFKPGTGPETNTFFEGAVDEWVCGTFAGMDPEDEDLDLVPPRRSKLWELRRSCWNEWPDKAGDDILFAYGFDEEVVEDDATPGTGPMFDSSMLYRTGSYKGTPSSAARVARRAQLGQFIGTTRRATVGDLRDGRINMAVAGGQVYYEVLIPGA